MFDKNLMSTLHKTLRDASKSLMKPTKNVKNGQK